MTDAKVAVITAGGRGMGAAIARELHRDGYELALMSPSGSAERLAGELGSGELGAVGITGSVMEPDDMKRLVEAAMDSYGRIDAVVNHTAHPPKGDLLEISDDDWHRGLDMMVLQVIRMCRLVTPIMLEQGGGAHVNITTFAAFEPELFLPVSCALRAGVSVFAKMYATKYADAGIRMNNLLPGYIDSLSHTEETRVKVPMQRIGTAEEIAKTTAFLLSEGAGYITGQNLRVDGGITRHV